MEHDIINWIEMNIENGITAECVAGYAGFCRKTTQIMFKNKYGISPGEYIRKRKLTRAAILLRMTKTGVTQIAYNLHYASHQNFIRAFRAYYGVTPGQYRLQKDTNLAGMQLSAALARVGILAAGIVYRDAMFIKGHRMSHMEPLGVAVSGIEKDRCHRSLLKAQGGCRCPIYQVSSFSLPLAAMDHHIAVRTLTGCTCQGAYSVDSHCIPAGYYARFSFQGVWQDFRLFCQAIYLTPLAELGWQCRWGYHVSVFNRHEDGNGKELRAECLIPVDITI